MTTLGLVATDQTGEQARLAALEPDHRGDGAGADGDRVLVGTHRAPSSPRFEISTLSLRVISRLWWTRGSTSILMPMSWYWKEVMGTDAAADGVRGVEAGDRNRHLVADQQARLLALGDPQLRLRQHLGFARRSWPG